MKDGLVKLLKKDYLNHGINAHWTKIIRLPLIFI